MNVKHRSQLYFQHIITMFVCVLFLIANASVAFSASSVTSVGNVQPMSRAAFEAMLKETLQKNPDLILDILRSNSEEILEIAQNGNILRKRKGIVAAWEADAQVPKHFQLENSFSKGKQDAPVVIIAYSDFTCGFCRQAEEVLDAVVKKYKNNIRYVFRPLPKEDSSLSLLAACYSTAAFLQDMDKGWLFYNTLFKNTDSLEKLGEGYLKELTTEVGLDIKKTSSLAAGKQVAEIMAIYRKEADDFDISGTPYFFVNDLVIRGAVPADLFEEAIKKALQHKKKK